jgi:Protoglobin
MKRVAENIPGYAYGEPLNAPSVSMAEFESLKVSVGFAPEDERYLEMAGEVLAGQTKQIVDHWRVQIIGKIPNLAQHSRTPDGAAIPEYTEKSGLRFEQWILDTCLRPYDQDWVNYQIEIALRHTTIKKNKTDGVRSTPYVPFRDILAFVAVMNETIKPYLAAKNHSADEVNRMHLAWCKSIQLQLALWAKPYTDKRQAANEW